MASSTDYLNISPENLKGFLIENLNKSKVYTDQIYEGSNISAIIDFQAALTNLMLYYLNQSANQGQFTETEIYENMNRIVKFLDYKPLGYQTALLNFRLFAKNILKETYTIPRFSFVESAGIRYSFNEDITVYKTIDNDLEEFSEIAKTKLLAQGVFIEHPSISAQGLASETILLSVEDTSYVDHFNIFVYVKNIKTGKWTEFSKIETLIFEKNDSEKFELRLNENLLYEITFGNGINSKQLNSGDEIAIYYLKSNGQLGEISSGYLNGKKLKVFYTPKLTNILKDTQPLTSFIVDGTPFIFQNDCASTYFKSYETVDEIRENAPRSFRAQYKITQNDEYFSFIRSNFSNIVQDNSILSNEDFLNQYYSFYKKINLFDPLKENRVIQSDLLFGTSCHFNNVYCPMIPKTIKFSNFYLTSHLKKLVVDSINKQKCTTSNFVPIDPIYLNLFLGVGNTLAKEDAHLQIIRYPNNNSSYIRQNIQHILNAFFDLKKSRLGSELKINDLTAQLLGIDGIESIRTINHAGVYVNGLQFYYTDLNHPSVIAGTVNTNTTFSPIFCWILKDLQYLLDNVEFV